MSNLMKQFFYSTFFYLLLYLASATFVASGCVVSPPMSAIYLRAGWSMGSVKDRYIHHESAGDQFVGQTVTGLSSLSTDFACSPPYFDCTLVEEGDGDMEKVMEDHIQASVIGGMSFTPKVKYMVKFFLASIMYHYDYLKSTLNPRNRLLSTPVFCHCEARLQKLVVV